MTTTTTRNLVAVTPGGEVTDEMLAGWYLIYTIREEYVPLAKVRKAFRDNGLDESRLPDQRRLEHVAQDACTKAERVRVNGRREEVRAQQVGRTEDFLIYQMTRHVHDLDNRVIEHPKALRVLFGFADGSLSFEPLEGASMEDVQALADEIQSNFDKNQTKLPGRGVRTIMRHYIEAAGAEWLRDGCYFMPKVSKLGADSKLRDHHGPVIDGAQFIASIQATLAQIYDTPEFHDIPCVNDEGQRAFLKRKFIENCAEDLKTFRDECVGLVTPAEGKERKRSVRADKRTAMIAARKAMDERRQKFAEILGETLDELDRDMGLADQALTKMLQEADL